ncbi:carbohydrate kinase family protein [Methanobrevibacter filiformis]|uniref:Adenosine kinase n=1 Tax=Methanobrevibacter filiformis TaxID=55758 RepID=A0A165ZFD9_9EURY|nr:carbohydrate kinase family protein [Methanobrevibacter filiformis]KZX10639.1 adenosine kinase [Methanobrevibacter filiformis]
MNNPRDLLVIGHTALDYIIKVENFPSINSSTSIDNLKNLHGGAAANVAVVGANLGLKTSLISAVGGTFPTSEYKEKLKKLDINTDNMIVVEDESTPTAFVLTDKNDDQVSYFYWGAGREFANSKVPQIAFSNVKAVHLATGDPDFNYRGGQIAKSLNKIVSFDPGQDLHMYTDEKLKEVLGNCNILFGNQYEIDWILNRLSIDIKELRYLGPEIIVKTLGKDGSIIYQEEEIFVESIYRPAVDPTGAGDSYRAGFLRCYLQGQDLKKCGEFASAVSSFIVEAEGCQTNIPTVKDVKDRIANK